MASLPAGASPGYYGFATVTASESCLLIADSTRLFEQNDLISLLL